MATTVIAALQEYVAGYTALPSEAPVWVALAGPSVAQYAVVPLPGPRKVEDYLDDSSLMEFSFAINSVESTADDLARLTAIGFFEALAEWFDSQTREGVLPVLSADKEPVSIQATTWGYLYQESESSVGIYQVQCKLTYIQQATQ